jgi:hypothetical protein
MQACQEAAMPVVRSVWPERELLLDALVVLVGSAMLTANAWGPVAMCQAADSCFKLLVSLRLLHRAATPRPRLLDFGGQATCR